jgi:hypothetical protein
MDAGNEKGAYLTMIGARVQLVAGSAVALSKAATIAIRYNCVRKQGRFLVIAEGMEDTGGVGPLAHFTEKDAAEKAAKAFSAASFSVKWAKGPTPPVSSSKVVFSKSGTHRDPRSKSRHTEK